MSLRISGYSASTDQSKSAPYSTVTVFDPSFVNEARNSGGEDVEGCWIIVATKENRGEEIGGEFVFVGLVDSVGVGWEPMVEQPPNNGPKEPAATCRTFRRVSEEGGMDLVT